MLEALVILAMGQAPLREGAGDGARALQEMQQEAILRALADARAPAGGWIQGQRIGDDLVEAARKAVGDLSPRAQDVPAALRDQIVLMDAAEWSVREEATRHAGDGRWTMPELRKALDDPTLAPEQRSRLEQALWTMWESKPRGALGISMSPGVGGVLVTSVHEGFPAARVLQAGDLIVAIDGEPITTNNQLINQVQAKGPGDRLKLVVDRAGPLAPAVQARKPERLELELVLGDFAVLERNNPRDTMRPAGRRDGFERVMQEERSHLTGASQQVVPGVPQGFIGVDGQGATAGTSTHPKMALEQLQHALSEAKDPTKRKVLEQHILEVRQQLIKGSSKSVKPRVDPNAIP